MTNSNRKGKEGELELCHFLEDLAGIKARRGQQYKGTPDSPDVLWIPGLHIECKRVEALNVNKAMEQATSECGDNVPVVMHRRNGMPWLFTCHLSELEEVAALLMDQKGGAT